MVSIKKNFYYNSILTISGYLFPILTFPYVTRVLGVSNIGIYNFVDSIIHLWQHYPQNTISCIPVTIV